MAYTEAEARKLVVEAGHRLLKEKLIARTWGNISARISEDAFVITPSGRSYDDLKEDELVVVGIKDLSYSGENKPSSEKGVHASAYVLCPEINFVIHTHQFFASVIAAEGADTNYAPCAGYGLPGTEKLRKNIARTIQKNPGKRCILMEKHGALCLGETDSDAFGYAAELENRCREIFEERIALDVGDTVSLEGVSVPGSAFSVPAQGKYTIGCSRYGKTVPAWIDDFAQIVGPDIRCCSPDWSDIGEKIRGRNAVLVRGLGALCTGERQQDAEAAAMILEKNCAASFYVKKARPLGKLDALIQRKAYLVKYSKKIDRKNGNT